jgi:hypothetical protein
VFFGSAADHGASVAHGLALGVLAHVRSRSHGVHGRGRHDVVPPPPPPATATAATAAAAATATAAATAGAALPHRADPPLSTAATAPPHRRSPARHDLPVAPPEPGGDVAAVAVTRFRQDVVLGLMKTHRSAAESAQPVRARPFVRKSIHPTVGRSIRRH